MGTTMSQARAERPSIPGQKRRYDYQPDTLEEESVFADLSVAAYAAAQALSNISAVWSRDDHDTLFVNFFAPDGQAYRAECITFLVRQVEDAEDEEMRREVAAAVPELYPLRWTSNLRVVRMSDMEVMHDPHCCGHLGGRPVFVKDLRPALAAIHAAVSAASERISSTREPIDN